MASYADYPLRRHTGTQGRFRLLCLLVVVLGAGLPNRDRWSCFGGMVWGKGRAGARGTPLGYACLSLTSFATWSLQESHVIDLLEKTESASPPWVHGSVCGTWWKLAGVECSVTRHSARHISGGTFHKVRLSSLGEPHPVVEFHETGFNNSSPTASTTVKRKVVPAIPRSGLKSIYSSIS